MTPRPPADEPPAERDRRLKIWLVVVSVIAVAAAAAAGYAISEIESTKDDNRKDDQAVSTLRADIDVMREQLGDRVDAVEGKVDTAADAKIQDQLRDDLTALQKRVSKLDEQTNDSGADDLTARIDDLEGRVDDLESKK